MLTAAAKAKLVSTLKGFDIEKLIAAVTNADEVDFEVPEVSVLTSDELTTRDTNTKADAKREGFKEGKIAGLEITGKALIKKLNLPDTTKADDPDKIADAIQASNTTGDAGLKDQIKLLQKDKETLEAEKLSIIKEKDALAFDNNIISSFPVNRTTDLSDAERLMLVKHTFTFETENGVTVVKKGGEIMREAGTQSPITPKAAIESLFTERKWIGEEGNGGRGGGDQGGGGTGGMTKLSEVEAAYVKANPGKTAIGEEFQAYLSPIAAKVTDFNYYE